MLSFSEETSQSVWFPKPQPPKQQGKTDQQTNLFSAAGGQFESIWPSKLQRAAQQDTRKPKLFGSVLPGNTAQILQQPNARLKQNCCLMGSNQGRVACEGGLLAGKQANVCL